MAVPLDDEGSRVWATANIELAPPVLSAIAVQTIPDALVFKGRMQEVIDSGLRVWNDAEPDIDESRDYGLPVWFSTKRRLEEPDVIRGRNEYVRQRDMEAFRDSEWVEMLDPDVRQWRWWDFTVVAPRLGLLWVDAGGEAVFNCEELFWAIYSCGARSVVGPITFPSSVWADAIAGG